MVATRKKPSAPAPPTSRTNSTQVLPRAVNAKPAYSNLSTSTDSHSDSSPSSSKDVPNGAPKSTHKTKSSQSKSKTPLARKEKWSLLDYLFMLFLATFAAYALYHCPSDSNLDNSLCRTLSTYRTHVLEPYVIPPIRAAITHPVVVEPYEKYAKPVYESYIQPVTPYVAAAHRRTAPYVNTAIHFSKHTSSRIWNTVIQPYWNRAVVPRYTLYVQPHVNKYVSPVIKRAKLYGHLAEPYVRSFAHRTSVYAHTAQKYATLVHDRSQPYVARAYSTVKPHVVSGYDRIKPLMFKVARVAQSKSKYVAGEAMVLSQVALGRAGDLRREFVDPHVLRIWEKAVEKSGPSQTEVKASSTSTAMTTPIPTQSKLPVSLDDIPSIDTDVEASTIETASHRTPVTESSTAEPAPLSSTVADSASKSVEEPETSEAHIPEIPTPTPDETLEKAAIVAEASAAHASDVVAEMESEIKEAETARVILEAIPDPVDPPVASPTETVASEQPPAEYEEPAAPPLDEEGLDDFFRDIGLDEEEEVPEPEPEPVILPQEEDPEVKKAATAAKRATIVGRHTRWQSELDALVKDLDRRIRQEIKDIRKEAVVYIGKLSSDKSNNVPAGKGQEVMNKIRNDGIKFLKGLEVYVNKLTSQTIPPSELEKEKEKWDKIVDKVEGKVKDVVRGAQEEVHNWYVLVREKETSAVLTAASEVKSLADRAQADLGLDYAWLDDVTYHDWQNYHELMRIYERFDQTARSLQNGTHPDAPQDKLIPLLNTLDSEVQRTIGGFAMKMNALVQQGDKWLSSASQPAPEPEREAEDGDDECEVYDEVYEDDEEEPQVSILPIPAEPSVEKVDPANVIIGKSAEQIEKMAQQAVVDQRVEL